MEQESSKALYYHNSLPITQKDFENALANAGVKKNDVIMVHSDISAFGKLSVFDRNLLFQALTDSIEKSVGSEGTVIMPTFSYSFDKNETFDVDNTKSTVGVLTEFFRKQHDATRTIHPSHSFAVWGKHKNDLLKIGKDTFDKNSVFGKFHQLNGKIVFFGAPFGSCTFVHYIEQAHGVPYRHIKKFRVNIIAGGKGYEDEITFNYKYSVFFISLQKLEKHLLEKGIMKEVKVGNGRILMVLADDLFKEGCKLLDKDIYFFLKNEPFIFRLFNICIYLFLKYMPWPVKILDHIAKKYLSRHNVEP